MLSSRNPLLREEYYSYMIDIRSKRGLNNYTLANTTRLANDLKQHTNDAEGIDWTTATMELFMAYFKQDEDVYVEQERHPKRDLLHPGYINLTSKFISTLLNYFISFLKRNKQVVSK